MGKIRVAVLRGGPSAEYDISLLTGENVLKHLPAEKYQTHDILISKDGLWHMDGFPSTPVKILSRVDAVFNAMHGEYGEDGKVQQVLEPFNVPYTGSGILACAMAMHKGIAKDVFEKAGLKTVRGMTIEKVTGLTDLEKKAKEIRDALFSPWVVKPASRGSSVGVTIAKNTPELIGGLNKAFKYDKAALVEEFIKGREATAGILENFRGEKYYALPVIEIIPPPGRFFDYEVKYNGATRELCPSHFDLATSRQIQHMAIMAHRVLNLRHYSRSDFMVSKKGIYILETNALPYLSLDASFVRAAEAIGLNFPNLLEHLISLTRS